MTNAPVINTTKSAPDKASRNHWWDVWDQFRHHKGAVVGLWILSFIVLFVLIGPLLWPWDPAKPDPRARNTWALWSCFGEPTLGTWRCLFPTDGVYPIKISWWHPIGTDQLGRDSFARLMAGGRVSLAVGLTAMLLSIFLGTMVGVFAGYFRRLDGVLMRLTDLFLALPLLPLLLILVSLYKDALTHWLGPELGAFILIVVAIGITSWMATSRIVRGEVLALKEREFMLAARSIGTKPLNMIGRHIIPNVISPVMVAATLGIANAIITESVLSFLGQGFPPDFPTWGSLLFDAIHTLELYPARVLLPGMLISLTVLSVNYIGDGLRDALDPRMRGR
jgi:peptide/nickel transport system permease protein